MTKIDKLVKELVAKRNTEDMSTYAQFFPGIITEEGKVIDREEGIGEDIQPELAEEHKKNTKRKASTRRS